MSVDRNYTFQISTTADSATPESARQRWVNASSKKIEDGGLKMSDMPKRDSHEIVEGTDNIEPGAALTREIEGILPDNNSGAVTSPALSTSSKEKTDGTFPDESMSEVMRYSGNFQKANRDFAGSQGDSQARGEPLQNQSNVNADDRSELVNQVRQLQASFQPQAPSITRQDLVEMLMTLRQLKEMFLERQRKIVTRQELKNELQTLRLAMEGRK